MKSALPIKIFLPLICSQLIVPERFPDWIRISDLLAVVFECSRVIVKELN
jgi:hypothetical protein